MDPSLVRKILKRYTRKKLLMKDLEILECSLKELMLEAANKTHRLVALVANFQTKNQVKKIIMPPMVLLTI
jgi:hypothetical protein